MAIILKTGKTYTDCCGNVYDNAYGVIDNVVTDKHSLYHKIKLRIFKDLASRTANLDPVIVIEHCATSDDFDECFSPVAISNDDNQYVQSYLYLLNLTKTVIVDEVETEVYVYADWESDE